MNLRASALASLAVFASSPAFATSPPSIYEHAESYPLGSRAAGMGGAYTALACDEAALHYNPAALACAGRSRIELAANAYMLQHIDVPDSLGPGQHIGATNYHPLPSIAGAVRLLANNDPNTGAGAIGVGFSISVPRSIYLAVDPPDPTQKDFFSISVRDDLLAGDLGVGWQVTPTLALGLSLGGVMRSFQSTEGLLLVRQEASMCGAETCYDFASGSETKELFALGGRAKLAARWTPTSNLAFGLTFVTPTIDVYGSATQNNSTTVALAVNDQNGAPFPYYVAVPERARGGSSVGLPGQVTLGAALTLERVTLSADVSLGLPRSVALTENLVALEIAGQAPSDPPEPESIDLELQPNVRVGVEYLVSSGVAIDVGLFTDLSATSSADLEADRADRIHMFGVTAALGLLGRQARSYFGLAFEAGSGTTRIRSENLTFDQLVRGDTETIESSYTRWNITGIIGSSYSFVDDEKLPERE